MEQRVGTSVAGCKKQSKGLSRQVCLLSEGWFDLGLEGWVDFNSRKGKGKRAILA